MTSLAAQRGTPQHQGPSRRHTVEGHRVPRAKRFAINNISLVDVHITTVFLNRWVINFAIEHEPTILVQHGEHLATTESQKRTARCWLGALLGALGILRISP